MQAVFRKLYMSILAATLILLTSIATTFAWVGMLTSSSLGSFDIDLKVEDTSNDYFLKIATDDLTECDKYGLSVPKENVQKQILKNMNIDYSASSITTSFDQFFDLKTRLRPVTTDKNLSYFKAIGDIRNQDIDLYDSNSYFKFDIYLTIDTYVPISDSTNINANVFFKNIETALNGVECSGALLNGNQFNNSNIIIPDEYSLLKNMPGSGLKINSADATRLAFAIYNPIDIEQQYTTESPSNYIIYQKGTKYPSYDSTSGLYSFGGILPEEYNIAAKEIEKLFDIDSNELKSKLTSDVLERSNFKYDDHGNLQIGEHPEYEDKFMTLSNYHIWEKTDVVSGTNYLGVSNGVRTKMKISIYFWFEGWDADCLNFIDGKSVDISLIFSTDTRNNS